MTIVRPKVDQPVINERIRFDRMQLISHEGKNLGVVTRDMALKEARAAGLDLVIIAEQGSEGVPVVKIMDFGKALYEKKKQMAEAKKKQHVIQVKEMKIRPKIAEHDFRTKMHQALQFLKDGKRLKVTLMFKGREAASRDERGAELLAKIEDFFAQEGLTARIAQEKDAKTPQSWTRIYYLKK